LSLVKIREAGLRGLFLVEIEPRLDERGYFARTFCAHEFSAAGLPDRFVQSSVSVNTRKGTVRGLHFQKAPSNEGKLVTCVRGRIFDVAVDIRPESPTYRQWASFELEEEAKTLLYLPPGMAHGFQTLEDDVVVSYQMTDFHQPELSDGVRWDDPAFAIRWPLAATVMSEKDRSLPEFSR
jgi:dTDP-4-dehydrorhamnose 3,5-epimerase